MFTSSPHQGEINEAVRLIGKNITGFQGDISNFADLDSLYATVKGRQKGRIDILFANAGMGDLAPLGEVSKANFNKTFGVNVKGPLFGFKNRIRCFRMAADVRSI